MDTDKKSGQLTHSRRKILKTTASIGLTGVIAGCAGTDSGSEATGTETATETGTETATETQEMLQRDGADAMPAAPISTHPRELTLEASDFGDGWEIVSSETGLDDESIYEAVDEGEQTTGQAVTLENTMQGAEIVYGPTIYTDPAAAAEVITVTEERVADRDWGDYSIDLGDSAVLYTYGQDASEGMAGSVVQEQNATVGMSYYGPDDTDISEWPDTVRPLMESAHALVANSY